MYHNSRDLASLIGSRICHDLISPIGAINNGLELLGMSHGTSGPELGLIGESVENASTRLRLFRLAFGAAGKQSVSAREIKTVLSASGRSGKLHWAWDLTESPSRSDVRVAMLAGLCLETAMPYGGQIEITQPGDATVITGTSQKFRDVPELWSILAGGLLPEDFAPEHVQFALLPMHAMAEQRRLSTEIAPDRIVISV